MNFASKSVIHENPLGSFTCRKVGTWDILFYFPSEGRHTEDFPDARKIQRLRPGLNPRTRVPVASMMNRVNTHSCLFGCSCTSPKCIFKFLFTPNWQQGSELNHLCNARQVTLSFVGGEAAWLLLLRSCNRKVVIPSNTSVVVTVAVRYFRHRKLWLSITVSTSQQSSDYWGGVTSFVDRKLP